MCNCLGQLRKVGYIQPFSRPVAVDRKTMELKVMPWHVALFMEGKTGKPNYRRSYLHQMVYCPFCGAKLAEEQPSGDV